MLGRRGRIDHILHGAGVLDDGLVETKTAESFRRVVRVKLGGLDALIDAARDQSAHLVAFSSVAAVFGSAGQADYAAANELMRDRILASAVAKHALVISWGPWRDLGMTAGKVSARLTSAKVPLLDPESATRACIREMEGRRTGHIMLAAGEA